MATLKVDIIIIINIIKIIIIHPVTGALPALSDQQVVTLFFFPSKQQQEATVDCLCQRGMRWVSRGALNSSVTNRFSRLDWSLGIKMIEFIKTLNNDCAPWFFF